MDEGAYISIADKVREVFALPGQDIRTYSPLTLAYIGDGIYDLIIRTMLVERGNSPVNKLHHRASAFVKAAAQREIMQAIEPMLTPEEHGYYKRGRNAKSSTSAKNASIGEYRTATGFEALLGYLYLTGQVERLFELVKAGTDYLVRSGGAMSAKNRTSDRGRKGTVSQKDREAQAEEAVLSGDRRTVQAGQEEEVSENYGSF